MSQAICNRAYVLSAQHMRETVEQWDMPVSTTSADVVLRQEERRWQPLRGVEIGACSAPARCYSKRSLRSRTRRELWQRRSRRLPSEPTSIGEPFISTLR